MVTKSKDYYKVLGVPRSASEVATKAALDAIQLHGGYGFVEDYAVGRYLLESKVLEVGEGNSQLHREIIADWAFGIRDY